jgi:uncharacterized protein (DUF2235 family)
MKNLVICCNGTNNEIGPRRSNVVRLYDLFDKDDKQMVYYDPGLGTISLAPIPSILLGLLTKVLGLAFGYGLTQNVAEAYRFLMQTYTAGDQIFFFGFSRGAYTVRTLAKLLARCSLLPRDRENLIPYALKIYRTGDHIVAQEVKHLFGRPCPLQFIGVWDTVRAVGLIKGLSLRRVDVHPEVSHVRQTIALDEKRRVYPICHWTHPTQTGQTVSERWFPGDHSDVGGGPLPGSVIADLTLRWIVHEAVVCSEVAGCKLRLDETAIKALPANLKLVRDCSITVHTRPQSFWRFTPQKERQVPANTELDESIADLQRIRSDYRPKNTPFANR